MSTIAAGTTSTTGLVQTSDTTGNLVLQVNGTTPTLTLNTAGAHGVGSSPSYGTAGQFLTSAGSGSAPTWTSAPASAMTLISTLTASNSASLAWTGLSGYNKYIIILDNILQANAGTQVLQIQVGTGSTTYITSGYYYAYMLFTASPISGKNNSASYFSTDASSGYFDNTTYRNGYINIEGFTSGYTNFQSIVNYPVPAGNNNNYGTCGGFVSNNTTKTAIKISMDSGNIASGTASLYGISS